MSKELVIAANRHEIKVAILEDDQLMEVFFQRANEYSLAGGIHKGRVTRVLPGMQSAFVDLGLERDTFLYVSDFSDETEDFDRVSMSREPRGGRPPAPDPAPAAVEAAEAEAPTGLAAMPETESAPVPPTERVDRGERQDRSGDRGVDRSGDRGGDRGRRSRRRRGRGRGFPDSKYASSESSRETSREPGRETGRPARFGEAPPAREVNAAPSETVP